MDPNEIARLCESLSIQSKEEKLWGVKDQLKVAAGKKLELCLVGKLLSSKNVNRDAFRAVMPRIWRAHGLEIEIHNAPLLCMTKELGEYLGKIIGDLVDIDVGLTGECFGKYLRVRVAIDISQPLKRFLMMDLAEDGSESLLLLRYEKLPDYCFCCGLVGHSYPMCTTNLTGGAQTAG
ncbi:hypothetical protein EZV62_005608 [Acer yangbiense]|uniref:Zinc knuckle CX2CX4HX4C domain-containing protein n=1 Tax=Acer yangbiense TaxID=1000413 RepID=A0A5C7IMU7_9ROSI|nr:hypothetical protein EZV62_005608 [Acer yangbiense]